MIKVAVTLTNNSLPNQGVCCHHVCHFIGVGGVLRSPFSCNRSGITVLEDATDKQLDFICGDRLVIG